MKNNASKDKKNERVEKLKANVISKDGKKKVKFTTKGKFENGYDGCGTHGHQ
ncbi:MAG: hypothetical protein KKA84_00880 [Bacteroidetes bacterium]|nr:hypothetical protein [Bacteroidota bacterium]